MHGCKPIKCWTFLISNISRIYDWIILIFYFLIKFNVKEGKRLRLIIGMGLVRNSFLSILSRINGWIILIFAHISTINIYERKSQKFPFRREFSLNVCLGMAISHVDWMIPWLTISSEWRTYLSVFCVKYVWMKGRD